MTRADRKNAVLKKTRLVSASAGRHSARNYEALSKTRYNFIRISNFDLKFLQYILNTLYFRIKQKKFDFFNPSYQTTILKNPKKSHTLKKITVHSNASNYFRFNILVSEKKI